MKKEFPKIETASDWAKAVNFVPKKDQIIVYDGEKDENGYISKPRLKIGDGKTRVADLPFESTTRIQYDPITKCLLSTEKARYDPITKCLSLFD